MPARTSGQQQSNATWVAATTDGECKRCSLTGQERLWIQQDASPSLRMHQTRSDDPRTFPSNLLTAGCSPSRSRTLAVMILTLTPP